MAGTIGVVDAARVLDRLAARGNRQMRRADLVGGWPLIGFTAAAWADRVSGFKLGGIPVTKEALTVERRVPAFPAVPRTLESSSAS